MDIEQRWIVVHSKAANERAEKTVIRQVARASKKLEKELFHLQAQRFACEHDAQRALAKLAKSAKYHHVNNITCVEHKVYEGKGRPKKGAEVKTIEWQITAGIEDDVMAIKYVTEQKSCFVLATNTDKKTFSPEMVLKHYKAQSVVESGFRFLKDPLFFVSSLFIKKPSRIDALLMIMTLSLLVYSIGQRRMRANMKKVEATIPNQINQATGTPTLRWVFQCFEGINLLQLEDEYDHNKIFIDGLDDLRRKIISLVGGHAKHLYKIKKLA
jgi:transposase